MRASKDERDWLEHIAQEINMLRNIHGVVPHEDNRLYLNILIDSFCIHARILYWFLANNKNNSQYTAKHFSKSYTRKIPPRISNTIARIGQQITHLTTSRFTDANEKINDERRNKLYDWIEEHLEVFQTRLDKHFLPHFKVCHRNSFKLQDLWKATPAINSVTTASSDALAIVLSKFIDNKT